jgi:Uma2 family endonuclease
MTAEEFYEWANRPENRGRVCELERGRIIEMSRPGKLHGMICGNVVRVLGNYAVQRKQGYMCSSDTGVVVERDPDTVRGPDVMFFEDADNVEQVGEKYGDKPPLLAAEVLSANDTHGRVMRRVHEQFRFGTRLDWVLDPDARNVIVHYPDGRDRVVEENEELTGNDVLPDFHCRVAEFFALPGR